MAGFEFELATPGLKSYYQSDAQPDVLIGTIPVYICCLACMIINSYQKKVLLNNLLVLCKDFTLH